jgi:hypothetical protein
MMIQATFLKPLLNKSVTTSVNVEMKLSFTLTPNLNGFRQDIKNNQILDQHNI